jgi:ABC-type transporter Mla maintaining outer membrane lipid asymmetry ATPase subunit MlaF
MCNKSIASGCATAVSAVRAGQTSSPNHSALVSKWFGIHTSSHFPTASLPRLPNPTPGQIILITGPSGSGKSSLLRRFRRRLTIPTINIPRIRLTRHAVIDHFPHISIESALAHLSRVGLAEAHCYLLPPRHLSDGQRWRLRFALALSHHFRDDGCATGGLSASAPSSQLHCFLGDEFTTLLDPITACVVARVLRRAISTDSNLCAILACSRTDILRALSPDLIIRCDFGNLQFWKKTKGESYEQQEGALQRACSIANRKSPIANPDELHSRPPLPRRRYARRL